MSRHPVLELSQQMKTLGRRQAGPVLEPRCFVQRWLTVSALGSGTDKAKVTERFHRPDFGHLEIEVTINDAKAYTKPWTVTVHQRIMVDTELIEFVCQENEQDAPLRGK